jgi:proline dehydrogenase
MEKLAPKVDFNNTRLAFRAKSLKQLRKAYWIYWAIDKPLLNAIGPKLLGLAIRLGLPVTGLVKSTLFEIFVGGENLQETAKTSQYLMEFNVRTILDFSKEGEKTEKGFEKTTEEILKMIRHAGKYDEVAFTAVKVTGIADFEVLERCQKVLQAGQEPEEGLKEREWASLQRIRGRIDRICATAVEEKTPVFLDAEESWIQDTIDMLAEEVMEKYNGENAWVATTLQMYRWDRIPYLKELIQRSRDKGYELGVKLVRGAYLEKENERAEEKGYKTPMHASKADTDRDFNEALRLCVENIDHVHVCAGTHNEKSSMLLTELMAQKGLEPGDSRVLFSQLLGMSDHISFNLGHGGYNTAKYVPYGPVRSVMPYLLRRADENTAVAGQSGRELQLLRKEVQRRRKERS